MKHLVSIVIPVYNQPHLLEKCLTSIRLQTFKNFNVVIIDDCSPAEYQTTLDKFPDLDIRCRKNSTNIGAMLNMKMLLEENWNTKYFMVFHEDDMMHPNLIEQQVLKMEANNDISFCGTLMTYFSDVSNFDTYQNSPMENDEFTILDTKSAFLSTFLSGNEICFGSILYRSSSENKRFFEVERYGPLCDRPFLMSLISPKYKGALIHNPLVFYRDHGPDDQRFSALSKTQILNFFENYKKIISGDASMLKKRFLDYSTNELLLFCKKSKKISYLKTLWIFLYALRTDLASLKTLKPKGLRVLGIYNLTFTLSKLKNK